MKILIIELSNLGDAILTYPALGAVWAAFPAAEFHLLAGPRTSDLFSSDPRVDRVWIWHKEDSLFQQISLIGRLRWQRFDWVIDFRRSLIPLFLGARRRTPLIRRPAPPAGEAADGSIHRADLHQALVSRLRVPPAVGTIPLATGPEERGVVEEWLATTDGGESVPRMVVMAPGARSHLKRWPADRFAAVADRLIAEEKVQVVLVGDSEERSITETVRKKMKHPALDLAGRTTIRQLAALLSRASLVITNDSACLHAAEAMEIPTVAIFGPTDEAKYGPRLDRSIVVRRNLVCAPCERALCPYGHECMTGLEVDEVVQAAIKILNS